MRKLFRKIAAGAALASAALGVFAPDAAAEQAEILVARFYGEEKKK